MLKGCESQYASKPTMLSEVGATKVTPLTTAHDAFAGAASLACRVNEMVDRLVGAAMESKNIQDSTSPLRPSGALHDLEDGARYALVAINRANEALDRLDREI